MPESSVENVHGRMRDITFWERANALVSSHSIIPLALPIILRIPEVQKLMSKGTLKEGVNDLRVRSVDQNDRTKISSDALPNSWTESSNVLMEEWRANQSTKRQRTGQESSIDTGEDFETLDAQVADEIPPTCAVQPWFSVLPR